MPLGLTGVRRRSATCAAVGLIVIGVTWRMAPLHLDPFAYKYGGSALWAAMVYCVLVALLPRLPQAQTGLIAAGVAGLVEFSRLWHLSALDAFRLTLAGKLLLGRFFAVRDIAAYWVAIAAAASVDLWWSNR